MNHFLYAPYCCRDCKHRFFEFIGSSKLSFISSLGLLASVGFFVTDLSVFKPDPVIASPVFANEVKPNRIHILEKAKQGKADDLFAMGLMYMPGGDASVNYKEALKWFDLAAKQGHAGAEFNLGLLYRNGRGVLQDVHRCCSMD